ncbi:hypothetical protein COCOBI_14-3980 [Coccomyxa sp. Obi]|nr:hypothetical protein COCOBI_14-3980 [Coccomyxa sp. Obi]
MNLECTIFNFPTFLREIKTAELEKSTEVEEVEATSSTDATEQKDETPSANVDEEQYPSRTPLAGGWAGGEVGLKQFVQEATKEQQEAPKAEAKGSAKKGAQPSKAQTAPKQVADEPGKYPSKESIGPFSGVTGGFAGGERGVQQFVEKGDVELAPEGQGSRQFSTLIIAGGAAVAASLGGLLLDDGVKLGEEAVENGGIPGVNLAAAPIDDNTRLLLQIGASLLILVGATIGVRTLAKQVQEGTGKLAEKVLDLGKVGVFWIGVFIAVKFVLESSN